MPQAAAQHQFKGFDDWIEVFKAGSHVDSQGRACSFTTADLDQIAANAAKFGPVPAVLGHPKHNDPAYGWGLLKRDGDTLFAKFDDVNPAFEAGVKSKAYRNRSISVYKDPVNGWRARHVGWLGAAPPAIDGLKPVEFAAEAPELHEFSAEVDPWTIAGALDDMAAALRSVREQLIATSGLAAADAAVPDWRITSLTANAARIREAATEDASEDSLSPFSAHTGADMSLTQADLDRTAAETEARVRAELAAQQSREFTAATELANRLLRERQAETIAAQIKDWKAAGLLLPAEEPGLAEFMAALQGEPNATAATFEFTAADKPVKKTAAQYFADFVATRGRLVKLGALADPQGDPGTGLDINNTDAIAKAALDFQAAEAKAGREISIAAAVSHVTRNPATKA